MKTPIEKAAEEMHELTVRSGMPLLPSDMVSIIRRRLEAEVPKKAHNPTLLDNRAAQHDKELIAAYNQCRIDAGFGEEDNDER